MPRGRPRKNAVEEAVEPKKRGRPRKTDNTVQTTLDDVPKKRGRPPKVKADIPVDTTFVPPKTRRKHVEEEEEDDEEEERIEIIEKNYTNLHADLKTVLKKRETTVMITFKDMTLKVVKGKPKTKPVIVKEQKFRLGDIGKMKYSKLVTEYIREGYEVTERFSNHDEMFKELRKKARSEKNGTNTDGMLPECRPSGDRGDGSVGTEGAGREEQ